MSEPQSSRTVQHSRLSTRIAVLSVGIAVLTALIAGALATGLIRTAGNDAGRRNLTRLADVTQAAIGTSPTTCARTATRVRLRRALQGLRVRTAVIRTSGQVNSNAALVRVAVSPADVAQVLAGRSVSTVRTIDGARVYVEARPTGPCGIALVQRRADAAAADERAIRRLLLALLVAGLLAAALGLAVAWRLARPLRRTAAAAHSLAAGNRDVALPAQGPAEIVEVSEAVNSLAAALRRSEARQREFLLSVSHDLRTPLTAITGYAESLADGVVPPEQAESVGGVVLGEAKRLERLVGDLLDLARLDARDFRVDLARTDVLGVVHEAAQVWAARCAAAGVRFTLETAQPQLWCYTDAGRVRQVLDGLFDNALRVTPAGQVIVLAARAEPHAVVIEVRDGGPGLTDADFAVAFEQGALHERYRVCGRWAPASAWRSSAGWSPGLAALCRQVMRSREAPGSRCASPWGRDYLMSTIRLAVNVVAPVPITTTRSPVATLLMDDVVPACLPPAALLAFGLVRVRICVPVRVRTFVVAPTAKVSVTLSAARTLIDVAETAVTVPLITS